MSPPEKPSDSRRTQLYKGVLDLALLSLLDEGPQYGLRILDHLREGAGLDLSEGTLYPLLHRLDKAGLIRSEWRHEADASHPRKYYALTEAGSAELISQRGDWLALTQKLNVFLMRRPL